jgi:chorismate mutase
MPHDDMVVVFSMEYHANKFQRDVTETLRKENQLQSSPLLHIQHFIFPRALKKCVTLVITITGLYNAN